MIEAFNKSMAMTLRLLEKFITSEVENLHFRVDGLAALSEKIEQRLDAVERQLSLIWLNIDELRQEVRYIKENFATKDDLKGFATKDDLKNFATKDDLKLFATKKDLERFATKADLASLEFRILKAIKSLQPGMA